MIMDIQVENDFVQWLSSHYLIGLLFFVGEKRSGLQHAIISAALSGVLLH